MAITDMTELNNGTILKVTPVDGNPNAIQIIAGSEEPFNKRFKNGITVDSTNLHTTENATFNLPVIINNQFSFKSIFSYTGTSAGATTLTSSDFGDATVFLIKPNGGETVTIQLAGQVNTQSRLYIIKKTTSNGTVTIDPSGNNKIDGNTSMSATATMSSMTIIWSGNTTDDFISIANNGFS